MVFYMQLHSVSDFPHSLFSIFNGKNLKRGIFCINTYAFSNFSDICNFIISDTERLHRWLGINRRHACNHILIYI